MTQRAQFRTMRMSGVLAVMAAVGIGTSGTGGRSAGTFALLPAGTASSVAPAADEARRAAEGRAPSPQPGQAYIPTDLEDCFAELQRLLPKDLLQTMRDAKEADMVRYHHGLGTRLRNDWGLWRGSRLSAYFNKLGIHHPDDMSGIILTSFWRHLHRVPLETESQVAGYQQYWERAKQDRAVEQKRVERLKAALPSLMMGLELADRATPVATLPNRAEGGLRARYLTRFREGVLVTVRQGGYGQMPFRLEPYFLELGRLSLRPVHVPDIDTISSAVVAGGEAYFLGKKQGRPALVTIAGDQRRVVALPRIDSEPQLGMDGEHALAVYPRSIYRLNNAVWETLYESDVELPWSGPPPYKVGTRVYFRDEGRGEDDKRLWWLELERPGRLVPLDRDCGLVGSEGPRWENVPSYATTPEGDLWAAVGTDISGRSLLRRMADGRYQVAIMNGKVKFDGNLLGVNSSAIDVSAVAVRAEGTLLVAGRTGLYRISSGRIEPLVSFGNTSQEIAIDGGKSIYHWDWEPAQLLELADKRYVIGGMFGGIYVLQRQSTDGFTVLPVDSVIGKAITL